MGLGPQDLINPKAEVKLRPLYNEWVQVAEEHLSAGWDYTNRLPVGQIRVRLACAWPILIGVKTLKLLRNGPVLDVKTVAKVSRREMRIMIFRSLALLPSRNAWKRQFEL